MTDQEPPHDQADPAETPAAPTPLTPPAPTKRRRAPLLIGLALAVLVIGVAVAVIVSKDDDGDETLIEAVQNAGYCTIDEDDVDETVPTSAPAPDDTSGETDMELLASILCAGLTIEEESDGWHITTSPDDEILMFGDLEDALKVIGEQTDCWGSIEVSKILGTRSLDGRVESRTGRASWTYHPDNGLDIICTR
jgi:hypothetical protein